MVPLEVLEQAWPGRLPCQQSPGYGCGGGAVQGDEVAQATLAADAGMTVLRVAMQRWASVARVRD